MSDSNSGKEPKAPKVTEKAEPAPRLKAAPKAVVDPEIDAQLLPGILLNLASVREMADEKRLMLWKNAQDRRSRRKATNLISGGLALASGSSTAILFAPIADILGVKIFAAALAFIAGIISIVNNTYLDDKENSEMYKGGSAYGEPRDRVDVVRTRPGLRSKEAHEAYERFAQQSARLSDAYDKFLDAHAMREISAKIAQKMEAERKRAVDAERSARATSNSSSPVGGGPYRETIFVGPSPITLGPKIPPLPGFSLPP